MPTIEAISTTYLEADVSSVTFSSIPATYEHLQLRGTASTDYSGSDVATLGIGLNGNTSANYAYHLLLARESSAVGSMATGNTKIPWPRFGCASCDSANFGAGCADILDYANTNKLTTVYLSAGINAPEVGVATDQVVCFGSGLLAGTTAAISIVTVTDWFGGNITRGSEFTLYGIQE